jgi:hypothetical protein
MFEKRKGNEGQEKEKIEKKKRDKRERSIHKYFALKILGFFLRISLT